MATNKAHELAIQLPFLVGVGVLANQPVLIGSLPGVALNNADVNGNASVDRMGSYFLPVTGTNAGGNVAVNNGDPLYAAGSNGSVVITKIATGVLYGYAYSAAVAVGALVIASGATATIEVILARP